MAKTYAKAESICLLSRDDDGDAVLWSPRIKTIEKIAGAWGVRHGVQAFYDYLLAVSTPDGRGPIISLPSIRKGSKARVRVTVEVFRDA